MQERGKVKPFPEGPVPCVWPVQLVEALSVDEGKKLVGCVEKQINRSLRWSRPVYRLPALSTRRDPSPDPEDELGSGRTRSAVISCSGFCESGRRNC